MDENLTAGLSKIEVIVQEFLGAAMQPSVWVYVAARAIQNTQTLR